METSKFKCHLSINVPMMLRIWRYLKSLAQIFSLGEGCNETHPGSVWVIHESWPQDQLDHYAKEQGWSLNWLIGNPGHLYSPLYCWDEFWTDGASWFRLWMRKRSLFDGVTSMAAWWFGCHFLFSNSVGFLIITIDFYVFQRGGPTTNQMAFTTRLYGEAERPRLHAVVMS